MFQPFEILVLALVLPMGATVVAFARRNLRHEPYRARFLAVGTALVGAASTFAVADHRGIMAASWIAISALTVALLRTGPTTTGARRALPSFLVGDVALLAGLALLATDTGPAGVAGALLVVAAAARAAVAPFSGWLEDSLSAPTVASALLHAGVVGAGPLLLIKEAPATTTLLAGALAVGLGAVSAIRGVRAAERRADVKGRLVWSTVTQMSFTLVLCGLGLHLAAGLHLVAHGAYKGTLFLGSGGAVAAAVRRQRAPHVATQLAPAAVVAPAVAVATAGAATVAIAGVPVDADLLVPATLAAVAATAAGAAWWHRATDGTDRALATVGAAGAVVAFLAVALALKALVGDSVGEGDATLSPVLAVPVLAALAVATGGLPIPSLPAWRPRPATDPALEQP